MEASTIYLILNALVYAIFLILITKSFLHGLSATSFVVGWYLFSALSSVLFYTHPITMSTSYYAPISWQGLSYFTGLTLCLIYPICHFEKGGYKLRNAISENTLLTIMKYLFALQIIVLVFYMPDFLRLVNSDYGMIRDAATVGDESTLSKKPYIISWCLTFNLALRNIITIFAVYTIVCIKKHRKFVIFFFVLSVIMPFFLSVLFVMRGYMVFQILLFLFLFILFREYFTVRIKKYIYIVGGIFLAIVIIFLINVSDNRFEDLVTWYYYKYAGETFVNFGSQMWSDFKDCTGGTVYFQWIGKLFGNDVIKMSLSDKWQYLNSVTGIDSHIFYGFIGGLVIEFHFFPTFLIVCGISFLFNKYIYSKTLKLSNLILIGSLANLLFTGSFLFSFQGLWGNFEIIFIVLSYLYIRILENKKKSL